MSTPSGKTILSGIQPSGNLHIGNYLGALKQWVEFQEDNTAYYCIVDEHAVIADYAPKELPEKVLNAAALYLAVGLDPDKCILFVQSHVAAHTELAWLLNTITYMGELQRMTQFKEKSQKQKGEINLGLFAYPVLQAADILLYQPNAVPVGEDQVQHIELTRDIAKRFNNKFGEAFTVPEAHVVKSAARIMSLTEPASKMSKSDAEKSYIALTDEPDVIRKKIASATTESEPVFSFEQSGPAVKNLLTIYQAFTDKDTADIEKEFEGQGYKEFKEALAEAIIEKLSPIQETYHELREDDDHLRIILARGKEHAAQAANQTLTDVKHKMGLL